MTRRAINDEFTQLDISRQQKWILRNPEKQSAYKAKYRASAKGKETDRKYRENAKKTVKGIDIKP